MEIKKFQRRVVLRVWVVSGPIGELKEAIKAVKTIEVDFEC